MIDLDALLVASMRMEALPASVTRLAGIVTREDVDLKEVVDVVALDQALTARLLKTANSAYAASRHRFATVKDAVVRLGTGIVLSFAMAAAIKRRMQEAAPAYDMEEGALWRHSVASALAAEAIRPKCKRVSLPGEVFTAALLHDVGKLAVARYAGAEANAEIARLRHEGAPTWRAEREVLGIDHAELGARLTAAWCLPDTLSSAIRGHHDDDPNAPRGALADAVELANTMAKAGESPDGAPAVAPDESLLTRLGFGEGEFLEGAADVRRRLGETLALYA